MFWITLRQYMEEREDLKDKQLAEGLPEVGSQAIPRRTRRMSFAPVFDDNYPSPFITWISDIIHSLLVKYWIWIVAFMLMVMSLSKKFK